MVIDAHVHLWKVQDGRVNGRPVRSVENGKSDFGGEIRQMQPPYMQNGENTAELLFANMDYARVNGAVVTQEYIDGNQDDYLKAVRQQYPERIRVCSLYEENDRYTLDGFDGIKICAARLTEPLINTLPVFREAERQGKFVSIDLAEGAGQVPVMEEIIRKCPDARIAIGHFGMVNRKDWEAQVNLARYPNVYLESGGITWLFHQEYYPYPSAIEAILRAKEICGMEKLMWGSDYPRTMTAITYLMAQDFVQKSDRLTKEEKEMFLGGNAEKFYGFAHQEPLPYVKNMVED